MSDLVYSTSVSPWGPGVPETIEYEYEILDFTIPGGTDTRSFTGGVDLLLISGEVTLGFTAAFNASIGIAAELSLQVGAVQLDYEIKVEEQVSDVLGTLNQKSFINTANWSVVSGSLDSTGTDPSESSAELTANGAISGELSGFIGGSVSVVGAGGWSDSSSFGIIPRFDVSGEALIAGVYPGEALVLESQFGDIELYIPSTAPMDTSTLISRDDGYANLAVEAVGEEFFIASLNLSRMLETSLGIRLADSWELPSPLTGEFGYTILDAQLTSSLALSQELTFVPGDVDITMVTTFAPTVDTQGNLLTLGETITGKLGDKFEFSTPQGEGSFTVDAKYVLDGRLTNTLTLYGTAGLTLEMLGLNIDIEADLGFVDVDIVEEEFMFYEQSWPIANGDIFSFPSISQTVELTVLETQYTIFYENFYVGTFGNDTFTLTTHQTDADGLSGNDTITGNALNNVITGGTGADILKGLGGNDRLSGDDGTDKLFGDAGSDTLKGGNGTDYLTGGAGADMFVAEVGIKEQSLKKGSISVDVVMDFTRGEDLIDFTKIDTDPLKPGIQAFNWVAYASGKGDNELAMRSYGSVDAAEDALGINIDGLSGMSPWTGPVTVLLGNPDGGAPEFAMVLLNTHTVTAADFML